MSLRLRQYGAPLYRRISELAPLGSILLAAAVIRTWQLSSNGFGREYYAAAVRSMMSCLHCFLFNSFDPAGFVSLDKPPIAIWLQVLTAKLIGFSGTAMLLPQVIEGLLAIALTYLLVQRAFGRIAGIAAAAILAITPVAVAVDRSNNMESCLVVVLLGASWAAVHAAETGRIWSLILSMALLGLGFNVKMGAALALAPVLLGIFVFVSGRNALAQRIAYAAVAGVVLVVVSLSWIAIFDFTPASARPYAGSTTGNSMLELAVLHNGANRFIARARVDGQAQAAVATAAIAAPVDAQLRRSLINNTPVGFLRLFRPRQAGQAAWWLPLALAGAFLGWYFTPPPARRQRIMIAACAGWIALYWLVFSFAGGVVHYYYLAVLAPPLAALAGIGVSRIVQCDAVDEVWRWALPTLLSITAAWQGYLVMGEVGVGGWSWVTGVWAASAALVLLISIMLALGRVPAARQQGVATKAMILGGFAALCVMPIACALSVVLVKPNPSIPIVDLAAYQDQEDGRMWRRGLRNSAATDKLLAYLQAQRGSERYLVAVPSSMTAAPLIIATGKPVIAMGGFAGSDPILTPKQLQGLIDTGQVRFVMIGGLRASRRRNANLEAIGEWVRAHGKPVEPELWRFDREATRQTAGARQATPAELFDFRS
jgi:4-amino-4-deoxy-L-arabinose transferase-like glycosyltransferase